MFLEFPHRFFNNFSEPCPSFTDDKSTFYAYFLSDTAFFLTLNISSSSSSFSLGLLFSLDLSFSFTFNRSLAGFYDD